jgi:hypothetical protein
LRATAHDQQRGVILQPVDMTEILFYFIFIFWIPCFAPEIGQRLQRVVMP